MARFLLADMGARVNDVAWKLLAAGKADERSVLADER